MSSPSPGPQSSIENAYHPSDTSEHALLSFNHTRQCIENNCPLENPKPCNIQCSHVKPSHHHNILNHPHHTTLSTSHSQNAINQAVHVHVHNSLNQVLPSKVSPPPCNCHLQSDNESNLEKHEVVAHGQNKNKIEVDDRIEVSPLPPALPPRPPPRPRSDGLGTLNSRSLPGDYSANPSGGGIRKYVFCCCACGGIATILGALFLAVYFLLRSYTSTLGYFETIPTFVPATMLILTGLCVMSLARRKNRYSYLIKVCGLCCLVCALTCVLVTITTTVIHMNRLQTLRECVYTQKTRTCTCYSVLLEAHATTDEGMRFVFDSTPDCEVIHGALYSCLRAMFGLSVSGILVCIFSCMLVYQLLSHEKKKMYWEQLELRCRSLYQQHTGTPASAHNSIRGPPMPPSTYCSCCEECRYPPVPAGPQIYPWDSHHPFDRFWTPGRVGNFYSPNPGEEGHEIGENGRERSGGGWNWRRLPWSRGNTNQQNMNDNPRDNSSTYQGVISSSDSQYGFSNRNERDSGQNNEPVSGSSGGSYSVLDNRPVGGVYIWGPPPPYSNPNSPARRPFHSPARHHHLHHPHPHNPLCQMSQENQTQSSQVRGRAQNQNKDNYENTADTEIHPPNENSESTDTSSCVDRISHTLPVRKIKKRAEISSVKSVSQPPVNSRASVQNVFNQNCKNYLEEEDHKHNDELKDIHKQNNNEGNQQCRFLPRLQGVENAAFQNQEGTPTKTEPTESEVYFADVSSCCNISVKNDGQDSSLYDEAVATQKPRLCSLKVGSKQHHKEKDFDPSDEALHKFHENISSSTVTEDEEYLAQKLGKRQMSTRSRLPFPLPDGDEIIMSEVPPDSHMLLPKDLSQNSLCSSVQTPLTETTDDAVSPSTPNYPKADCCLGYFPDSSGTEQLGRHRTFSNSSTNHFLAPDAQYEVIHENENQKYCHNFSENCGSSLNFSNLTNTISGLHNFNQSYHNNNFGNPNFNNPSNVNYNSPKCGSPSQKNIPPKTLNLNQSPNRRIGSNISTLIQNLGANPVGLLYGEANSTEEEEMQGQGSHSDGTMDSGWQSGSEKQDKSKNNSDNAAPHKAVNV
ncbi:homeobox protein 2 isoform X2 [Agrilus planipennis]|uniref:Homeobox protein 2 isoform X2 n=1 Tax=Agrilus planipennis TaxID=224129 RepID=A0A1W4X5R8_AGRPL|nr:homeobox protein 2 isoform X2 [Agrilus planipennis]